MEIPTHEFAQASWPSPSFFFLKMFSTLALQLLVSLQLIWNLFVPEFIQCLAKTVTWPSLEKVALYIIPTCLHFGLHWWSVDRVLEYYLSVTQCWRRTLVNKTKEMLRHLMKSIITNSNDNYVILIPPFLEGFLMPNVVFSFLVLHRIIRISMHNYMIHSPSRIKPTQGL